MSDDTSKVRVTHQVPEELRDTAQDVSEHGELSEAVRGVYRAVAAGRTQPGFEAVEAEKALLRRQRELAEKQCEKYERWIDTLDERMAELDARYGATEDREAEYTEALERLERDVRDGMCVFESHGRVQQAAKTAGKHPEEVVEDLRERNPDLPERAFMQAFETDLPWHGTERSRDEVVES